ncbi:hypothetical protein CUMW_041040 [Citrus unshiu]|nr:hypothetical protein CUMW_041040 [Citrus unshiu]
MELENVKKTVGNDHDEPKINYRGWKAMPFIIGNETFEKLGAVGTLANLLIYLTSVFNMKNITAATIINIFNGTANFGTMIGAYLCDTYFGRYKTLGFATVASFLVLASALEQRVSGLQAIQLTAAIPNLHPPNCAAESSTCKGPTAGQMAFLLSGFGLMIIGAGGVRPCNLAFGADQFNPNTESGKRGINSFFNWYFCTFTFAQMVSLTLIVYVQSNVSWAIGLAIPALLMLIACSINCKLRHTDQFRFLDKAAMLTPEDHINPDGSAANRWRLCSVQQVEEVKCVLRVLPTWFAAVIFHLMINQQHTYAVFQAQQSNRRLGNISFKIPAASYVVFMMLSMTIWIPIYDRIFVPFLRRLTGKEGGITLLQRMGIGIGISIITMLVSGVVEEHRRTTALTKPTVGFQPRRGAVSSMSGMFLIPQFALAGLADAFTSIGLVEFYYKQFPENMRSIGGSLFFCALAGSSYLSSLLITIVHQTTQGAATGNWLPEDLNKGRLDYYYYMIAALEVLNLGYFLVYARWYEYKETGTGSATAIEFEANGEAKQSDKTLV